MSTTATLAGILRTCGILAVLGLANGSSNATSIPHKPLDEIVADSDHILVARIVKVDMVNRWGSQVTDRKARTGPGSDNRLRLHLQVLDVRFTACVREPRRVIVPLWSAWHYELGTMKDQLEGSDGIFLLKGAGFEPAYPADFQRGLEEGKEIAGLVDALRMERGQPQMKCREDRSSARGA